MMILLAASTKDAASMNIRQQIIQHYDFERLSERFHDNSIFQKTISATEVRIVTLNEELILFQEIEKFFTPELFIYLSRHKSKSRRPTLSVHTPGNFTTAEKGGIDRKISIAPSYAMKCALLEMNRRAGVSLPYEISYECTHHGPSLDTPAMFIELGSSESEWKDIKAAEALAHATIAALSQTPEDAIVAIGIGGPHYSKKFTKLALTGPYAFGHIIPKYLVSSVDSSLLTQCLERTVEHVDAILLDWKGIKGADKHSLVEVVQNIGIDVEKV
jgi:D-aminoacyl-tRNA deacylase